MTALYSVGTWDTNKQSYRPLRPVRDFINVDIHGLRRALKELRQRGYSAYRVRFNDGSRDSDWATLVERTDGEPVRAILKRWER